MLNPKQEILDKENNEHISLMNKIHSLNLKLEEYKECYGLKIQWGGTCQPNYFYKCTRLKMNDLTCFLDKDNRKCNTIKSCEYRCLKESNKFEKYYSKLINELWDCGVHINYQQNIGGDYSFLIVMIVVLIVVLLIIKINC